MNLEKEVIPPSVEIPKLFSATAEAFADEQDMLVNFEEQDTENPDVTSLTFVPYYLHLPGLPNGRTLEKTEAETFISTVISRIRDAYTDRNWAEALDIITDDSGIIRVNVNYKQLKL